MARRGYRFIAPVTVDAYEAAIEGGTLQPVGKTPVTSTSHRQRSPL